MAGPGKAESGIRFNAAQSHTDEIIVPHDPADPGFAKMVGRLASVAEIFAASNLEVGLETGQETAAGLQR